MTLLHEDLVCDSKFFQSVLQTEILEFGALN